jgi:PIN domain
LRGLTLDAGALIAVERRDERVLALLDRVLAMPDAILHIPTGVLAQAFRDGPRQARLTRLLKKTQTHVVPLDIRTALAAGMLLGRRGCSDVVDASVVVCARIHRQGVVTSDPDDLRRLDPELPLEVV